MEKSHYTILIILLPLFLLGQNNVCFEIEENPNPNDPAFGVFTKYVNVLDCFHVYAVSTISDAKVLHVAAVAAELLDNDENGIIDDPKIKDELTNNYTVMPVFQSENGNAIDTFFDNFDECTGAVLFRNEIDPTQPGHWGDDATVEEVLHTINSCGHVEVYPELFALEPNSSELTDAMDVARGGQFITIPNPYPDEAWYHYDDWTCEYDCMAMEYLYWCVVTNMGILADTQTCNGIANEWEPCTPTMFESIDTLMFNLVTNYENNLPQLAPDGNYCTGNTSVVEENLPESISLVSIYPNPFNPTTKIRFSVENQHPVSLQIIDITGRLIDTLIDDTVGPREYEFTWNASTVPSGVYFIRFDVGSTHMTKKVIFLK